MMVLNRMGLLAPVLAATLLAACGGGGGGGGGSSPTFPTYHVGVTVSGLPAGKSIVLLDNGGNNLTVSANGTLSNFNGTVISGAAYAVSVLSQPAWGICVLGSNASGTVASADVNVTVTCKTATTSSFHVGAMVSGLPSGQSVTLQDNGGDNLVVSSNGVRANFATTLAGGANYAVTILAQPAGGVCVLGGNARGAITHVDVVVDIACFVATPTVTTDKGPVTGVGTASMQEFLGIPYAAPPVGALRWQPPQPAAVWSTPLNATSFGSPCPQSASYFGTASTSEDCLYLNVYIPVGAGPYPVIVFVHGGSLTSGEGSDYDPTALVGAGVAVVTLNYRLGALGFLAHPALDATSNPAANYGLMDQQAALTWVKNNIAQFGGDAANITLFGQSTGGLEVLAQIVSPLANGLFHKAIVESGSYGVTFPSLSTAETLGTGFGTAAGCPSPQTAACLRALPVSTILANQEGALMPTGTLLPTVDGVLLTQDIATALTSGSIASKVPMIEGNNQHEFSLVSATTLDAGLGREITSDEYTRYITASFPIGYATVLAAYPVGSYSTPAWAYDDVFTDAVFSCNGRTIAQKLNAAGVTVYAYEFADANAPMVYAIPARAEGYGAYHSAELQYVFPTAGYHIYFGSPFTSAQSSLSAQMVSMWAQFALTGSPNTGGGSLWPAYTSTNDTYLTLAPGAVATTTGFAAEHNCAPLGQALW